MILLGNSFIRLVQRKTAVLIWSLMLSPVELGEYPDAQPSWCPCALCLRNTGWRCILYLRLPPPLCARAWVAFISISTWLEGFSPGTPVSVPLPKSTLSQKHLPSGYCALGSCMTVWRQPEARFICIRPTRLSCALHNSTPGARVIRTHYDIKKNYYYYYCHGCCCCCCCLRRISGFHIDYHSGVWSWRRNSSNLHCRDSFTNDKRMIGEQLKFSFLIRQLAFFVRNSWNEIVGSLLIWSKTNKQAKNTCKMYSRRKMLKYTSTPTFYSFSSNSAGKFSLFRRMSYLLNRMFDNPLP